MGFRSCRYPILTGALIYRNFAQGILYVLAANFKRNTWLKLTQFYSLSSWEVIKLIFSLLGIILNSENWHWYTPHACSCRMCLRYQNTTNCFNYASHSIFSAIIFHGSKDLGSPTVMRQFFFNMYPLIQNHDRFK